MRAPLAACIAFTSRHTICFFVFFVSVVYRGGEAILAWHLVESFWPSRNPFPFKSSRPVERGRFSPPRPRGPPEKEKKKLKGGQR